MKDKHKIKPLLGYYFPLIGMLFLFVASMLYQIGYNGTTYYQVVCFLLPLLGFFFALIAFFFDKTRKYVSLFLLLISFLSLLFFIGFTYLYLSEVFYEGFSFSAMGKLSPFFILVFLFELISIVLFNIGVYHSPNKEVR